jgi:hypothetical protein
MKKPGESRIAPVRWQKGEEGFATSSVHHSRLPTMPRIGCSAGPGVRKSACREKGKGAASMSRLGRETREAVFAGKDESPFKERRKRMFVTKSHKLFAALLGLASLALQPGANASATIKAGWDLLHTDPTLTVFMGQNWQGEPLGTFDFGLPIGMKTVGSVDTIVRRMGEAVGSLGGSAVVPIEFVALQLRSVNPFDPDGAGALPTDFYYVTLQSGPTSGGSLTINFNAAEPEPIPLVPPPYYTTPPPPDLSHGSYSMQFTINYDVRWGALGGPIIDSDSLTMTGNGFWSHFPTVGHGPLIEGVNYRLDDDWQGTDFWLYGPGQHTHPFASHGVSNPEPQQFGLLAALGLGFFSAYRRVRRS